MELCSIPQSKGVRQVQLSIRGIVRYLVNRRGKRFRLLRGNNLSTNDEL